LSACRDFANAFQEKLTERRKNTVYIGMAAYPLAEFKREDTVDNAWKALNHATVLGPGSVVALDAVSLNISGDTLYQDGNLAGAIEEYQNALMLDPLDSNVHNSLGVCYGMQGSYEEAASEFDFVLRLNPDEVMALYNRAVICLLTGDNALSRSFVEKALIGNDDIFEILLLAGKLYLENGDLEKAVSFLEKAVSARPKSSKALRHLGACLTSLERLRDAASVYSRAVRINPNDAESLSELGILYDRIGENPEIARLFCRQSVAIAPENEIYRQRLSLLEEHV
jgi:Flp pilus assembly protein TadD